jgi:hypothetical protein
VFERENMQTALKRVESNKGAAGVDGMEVQELRGYLQEYWLEVREALERGTYRASPVRRVEIPKPDGGVRELGIPMWHSHCTSYNRVGYSVGEYEMELSQCTTCCSFGDVFFPALLNRFA